jgi:type IV secretion system protein VirB11
LSYSSEVEEVLARQKSADLRNMLAPIIPTLEQPDTREIDLNGDGRVWIENDTGKHEAPFRTTESERKQIVTILAGQTGRQVHALSSRFEGALPDYDTRVHALCPSISPGWPIMLRRHAAQVYDLAYYIRHGLITVTQAIALRQAIRRRDTIFVTGSFGSGKTTFENMILHEKARRFPDERMVIIQDSPELKSSHADTLWIFARVLQERLDSHGGKVQFLYDFKDTIMDLARSNASAVTVGEVRDYLCWLGLCQAMNVGLRGVSFTSHSNSSREFLDRAEGFVLEAGRIPIRKDLARILHFGVHMKKNRFGKHSVAEVMRVRPDLVNNDYDVEYIA